jgi:hypothetical protein
VAEPESSRSWRVRQFAETMRARIVSADTTGGARERSPLGCRPSTSVPGGSALSGRGVGRVQAGAAEVRGLHARRIGSRSDGP